MKNVGTLDKIIRLIIAAGLFALGAILEGNLRFISIIGVVPLFTAFFGLCPIYSIFGISSCKIKK